MGAYGLPTARTTGLVKSKLPVWVEGWLLGSVGSTEVRVCDMGSDDDFTPQEHIRFQL